MNEHEQSKQAPGSVEPAREASRDAAPPAPSPETAAANAAAFESATPGDDTGAVSDPGGTTPSGEAPTTAAPSQQEMAVRSALETVMDPEIGLSVIDLGLIREVHLLPDRTHIRMMLTTPFCPYAGQMMEDVKQATMSVVPLPCEVEIMPDAWSPQLMPDPGLLGFSY